LAFDATPDLGFMVGGNINDSELTSLAASTTSNNIGDRLDFIPDYTLTASGEYRFDWGSNLPGFFRVDYSEIGPATFTDRSLGIIEYETDTSHLLGARLGLEHGPWSFQLFGQNLLGDDAQEAPQGAL